MRQECPQSQGTGSFKNEDKDSSVKSSHGVKIIADRCSLDLVLQVVTDGLWQFHWRSRGWMPEAGEE